MDKKVKIDSVDPPPIIIKDDEEETEELPKIETKENTEWGQMNLHEHYVEYDSDTDKNFALFKSLVNKRQNQRDLMATKSKKLNAKRIKQTGIVPWNSAQTGTKRKSYCDPENPCFYCKQFIEQHNAHLISLANSIPSTKPKIPPCSKRKAYFDSATEKEEK